MRPIMPRRAFLISGASALALSMTSPVKSARSARLMSEFGAIPDGVTDCTKAFSAAAQSGEDVQVDGGGDGYLIASTIEDTGGARMVANGPATLLVPHRNPYLVLSGRSSLWSGFNVRTRPLRNSYQIKLETTATGNTLKGWRFDGSNSSILCSGPENLFEDLFWSNIYGMCMRFDGMAVGNQARNLEVVNGNQGIVLCEAGSHHNHFDGLRKSVDPNKLHPDLVKKYRDNRIGGDALACVTESHSNTASNIYCSDMREGGITCTGDNNEFSVGRIERSGSSGVNLGGSGNKLRGFEIRECKVGVSFTAQAGGLASDNQVEDCHVFDARTYGFYAGRWAYREWSPGPQQQRSAAAYCYYGNNIYQTVGRKKVFGTVPPTHTSGTQSDGEVDWTFLKSFVGEPYGEGNIVQRSSATGSRKRDWKLDKPNALRRL